MSVTYSDSIDRIRWLLNDRDPADYLASFDRLKRMVHDHYHAIAAQVGLSQESYTLPVISGTSDYALAASATLETIISVLLDNNMIVDRVSWDAMNLLRQLGVTPGGDPQSYAVYETTAQADTIRFWPTPNRSFNMTVWLSKMPIALSLSSDSANTLLLSDGLARVVEKSVAMDVMLLVGPERAQKRDMTKDIIARWQASVERGIKAERVRLARIGRTGTVELARF